MAKVSIRTLAMATAVFPPEGISGGSGTLAFFNRDGDPIHLHMHRVERDTALRIEPPAIDCLAYVWQGEVDAGGRRLDRGSSLIVEHGAMLEIVGRAGESVILTFAAGQVPANQKAGGRVHLLPSDRVPRVDASETSSTSGGLHADANCPTCELWLNENSIPGRNSIPTPAEEAKGVHSHGEDEVIFVTGGQIRLGAKLYGKGTALAVAARTFYGFSPGPEGLHFVTFRSAKPGGTRFPSGLERADNYWDSAGPPPFLEPTGR